MGDAAVFHPLGVAALAPIPQFVKECLRFLEAMSVSDIIPSLEGPKERGSGHMVIATQTETAFIAG